MCVARGAGSYRAGLLPGGLAAPAPAQSWGGCGSSSSSARAAGKGRNNCVELMPEPTAGSAAHGQLCSVESVPFARSQLG